MSYVYYVCIALATIAMITVMRESRRSGRYALLTLLQDRFRCSDGYSLPLFLGILAGCTVVFLPVIIFAIKGWAKVEFGSGWHVSNLGLSLLVVAVLFVWAAVEELIFRGAVLELACRHWPRWFALLASAIVFSGAHIGHSKPDPLTLFVQFLDGVAFGILYLSTGNLWASTAWHAAKNISVWFIGSFPYGFPQGPMRISYSEPMDSLRLVHVLVTIVVVVVAAILLWIFPVRRVEDV